jgi:phosphoribosylformimino-5-aminoimidazole carboxamide ribotide isomerase
VTEAARLYPGRVAVALDARDGKVAVAGWAETSELSAFDVARRFEDAGIAALVYTDVARDGMLAGLNLDAAIALAEAVSIPVIASGGLASIVDVAALLQPRARKLAGAIAGRALYDGRLDPAEALRLIRSARASTSEERVRLTFTFRAEVILLILPEVGSLRHALCFGSAACHGSSPRLESSRRQ